MGGSFHCVGCSLEMHLTEVCTGLTSVAINGIKELVVSVSLFLTSMWLTTGVRDPGGHYYPKRSSKCPFPDSEAKFEKIDRKMSLIMELKVNSSEESLTKINESKVPSGPKVEIPNQKPRRLTMTPKKDCAFRVNQPNR